MENKKEPNIDYNENSVDESQQGKRDYKTLPPFYIYPLGGQGEVGKNSYCIEMGNEIFVIDAGIKFAHESVSIEGIIPSYEHLIRNQSKIRGLIITHGHEDHIGSVPHLLHQVNIPEIWTGRLTAALVDSKIHERGVKKPKVRVINNKSYIKTRNFEINFYNVIHSTPDSFGLEIKTKHGTVVTTGDFKFDFTPVGVRADLSKIASFGKQNIALLLADSTNAEVDRWSISERQVARNIEKIFKRVQGRIIATTFASNVYRVRELIEIALKYNRKICVFGWSMDKVIHISKKIKYINAPEKYFIEDGKELKNYKDEEILILCTGGQGEQNAALSKMADGRHPNVSLKKGDNVIFSTNAIPGNYEAVEKLTNRLIKTGVNVYNNADYPGIHTSGHAGVLEQQLMLSLIRPKYFLPIHGETKMLVAHSKTAIETGVDKNNIFILPNGGRVKLVNEEVSMAGKVFAEDVFIDDTNLTGQSNKVISDRTRMAKNGIATITISISSKKNELISKPIFESKGVFSERNNKPFISKIETAIEKGLDDFYRSGEKVTFSGLKEVIRAIVEEMIYTDKKINPIVVPIILNVDTLIDQQQ